MRQKKKEAPTALSAIVAEKRRGLDCGSLYNQGVRRCWKAGLPKESAASCSRLAWRFSE